MENFNLKQLRGKVVHFIGIGGISMSALAMMLKKDKIYVQGSDEVSNEEVQRLRRNGVVVFVGHSKHNMKNVDVVVYNSAIGDDNEELAFAKQKGLLIIKRAELLGMVARRHKFVISVAGSHGKTTTSAMIAEMLIAAGFKPTVHVGGVINSLNSNHKIGNKKYFVTESCEYKDNYLNIFPDVSVILNVDADHLDYFGSINGVKMSFLKFAKNTKNGGVNVVSADDKNSKMLIGLDNSISFGYSKNALMRARNIKEYKPCHYSFDAYFSGYKMGRVKLNILGAHNVLNALACLVVAMAFGIDFCDAKAAIENFSGVKRRCQKITEEGGVCVYHDYAHHPKQIESMIKVARQITHKTKGKVIVVFEPHTYSRTKFLIDEFAVAFNEADNVIIVPVYSARELPTAGFDALKLASEIKQHNPNVDYLETYAEIYKRLKTLAKKDDVVMILGAGKIEKLAEEFGDK